MSTDPDTQLAFKMLTKTINGWMDGCSHRALSETPLPILDLKVTELSFDLVSENSFGLH